MAPEEWRKQVSNGGPKDIKRHRTKVSRHGDLAPRVFKPIPKRHY